MIEKNKEYAKRYYEKKKETIKEKHKESAIKQRMSDNLDKRQIIDSKINDKKLKINLDELIEQSQIINVQINILKFNIKNNIL